MVFMFVCVKCVKERFCVTGITQPGHAVTVCKGTFLCDLHDGEVLRLRCTSSYANTAGRLFRFPKDATRAQLWAEKIGRPCSIDDARNPVCEVYMQLAQFWVEEGTMKVE